MAHGSIHGFDHGFVHGFVYGLVHGTVHGLVYGTWFIWFMMPIIKVLCTWWTTLYFSLQCPPADLNHVIPLRPFKTVLHNVLLDHGGLPCVLPFTVHLDLGHLPDTQGYLGLLSEPCSPTQTL